MTQSIKNLPVMQETRVQSLGQEDPLEKGLATHSSMLVWRIPWTEEPGRMLAMGLQRVDMNERLAFSLFFQSPTHKWTLNDRISPPHSSFVGRRRGEVYKEGNKKWKLPDSRRETQVFSSIPSGFVQF